MPLLVPDVGEVLFLKWALNNAAPENQTLHLFVNNVTPAESDTAASYTEAAGGGYASKALTGSSWSIGTVAGVTSGTYAAQVFTFSGALTTNPTIYGYFFKAATSGTLLLAEAAASSYTPTTSGDYYTVNPVVTLQ